MDIVGNEDRSSHSQRSHKPRGRPKLRPDEVQRDMIVSAARAIYLSRGYASTTMDAVATRCGMSKRTLYRLFPTKIDLLKAIVVDHRRSMLELPRPDDDAPLDQALAEIFRFDIDEREFDERTAFIRFTLAEAALFPEITAILVADGAGVSRAMLAQWLERQVERGRLAIPDPLAAARMLMDMIFGVFVGRFPEDAIRDHPTRLAYARGCIDVFLDGTRSRPGP